jgi:hypothetical protein
MTQLPDTNTVEELERENYALRKALRKLDKKMLSWLRNGLPRGRYAIHNIRTDYAELLGIDNDVKNYQ